MQRITLNAAGLEVLVDAISLDSNVDIALDHAWQGLSDPEKERANRFLMDRDRNRFVRGRGYLRQRLADELSCAPREVPITVEPLGKPKVDRSGPAFNLSNSAGYAVLAISWDASIGIDLETFDRSDAFREDLGSLARRCMTQSEQVVLEELSADDRLVRFFQFWTAKEARMKLTGDGMSLEPRRICLRLFNGQPVGIEAPGAPECALRFVSVPWDDAVCCICLPAAETT